MMKAVVFVALAFLCVATLARPVTKTRWHELKAKKYTFEHYESEFNKVYATEAERIARREIFTANLARIHEHNSRPFGSWKAGVNHLTDRSEEELAQMRGYKRHINHRSHVREGRDMMATDFLDHIENEGVNIKDIPPSVDWRLTGAVTPVKDQGQCGSCWTFASAESIESAWYLRTGQLMELSEQQIASCTPNPLSCGGTGGCEGGTAEVAFQGVIQAGGIASEWTYPYSTWNGADALCKLNTTTPGFHFSPVANLSSYVQLPVNDQDSLLAAVAKIGPIAISVDASAWSLYETGVFNSCNQTSPTIDHAVQLVGYGTDGSLGDYWLVRNSWTPTWGEDGYIRIARPAKPTCGVDPTPGDGTACKPYPATQIVCGVCGILSDSAYPIVGV